MKLTVILVTAVLVHVTAGTLAQQRVTIVARATPLSEVFRQIEQQTHFTFFYKVDLLATGKPVSVDLRDVPIDTALEKCFSNQPFTYSIQGKIITVTPKPVEKHLEPEKTTPPYKVVSGTVLSVTGTPLADASVKIKGTSQGTTTDSRGRFTLSVSEGDILLISYVGYAPMNVRVTARGAALVLTEARQAPGADLATGPDGLVIKMAPLDPKLDETQIIAYGTSSKRFLTGSASTVKSETIEEQPVTNVLTALQGRVPGVLVTSANGVPGSAPTVQIRGNNSVSALSNPLYIVDGIPLPATSLSNYNINTIAVSPFNSINPMDIESVTILKDAEATAIYGSRGANGVVLITTKKGKAGKTKFDLNAYTGSSAATRVPDFMNTQQYLHIRTQAFAADNITPTTANAQDLLLWSQTAYTNFPKLVMGNTAPLTNVQGTLSGGSENTHFLLGLGYHHEGAIIFGDNHDNRVDGHLNIDHTSTDKRFTITASATYSKDNVKTLASDPFLAIMAPPNFPHYDTTGALYWVGANTSTPLTNPWSYLNKVGKTVTDNVIANTTIRYELLQGLNARINIGYTKMFMDQEMLAPSTAYNPASFSNTKSMAQFGNSSTESYIVEPQLDYTRRFGKGVLNALAGGTAQSSLSNSSSITGINFTSDDLIESITAANIITGETQTSDQYKYISGFGRLNFRWMDRYLVNGTFRRDGSSRFGPGRRFGNFWSVSGGWIFTEEAPLKALAPVLSFGKLRASYGLAGNDQIQDYRYLETYTSNYEAYNGNLGLYSNNIANPDYGWEVNKKLEMAMDLGFLDNRVMLTGAWYRSRANNQLVQTPLPSQTGFTYYQANLPALVQNNSLEFELNSTNINHRNFRWQTTFNITIPKNKLVSFPGLASSAYAYYYTVGQSLSVIQGYHFTGISAADGTPQFEDVNKDGNITSHTDYVVLGSQDPKFYGGLGNSFSYKGFSLDLFFQFTKQKGWNALHAYYYPVGYKVNLPAWLATDNWTPTHTRASQPGLTTTVGSKTGYYYVYDLPYSDAAFSDASYLRLKNLALSYNLPQKLVKKANMQNIRVYILGQNLLTLTHYKGFDPEVMNATPVLRTLTGGLQLTF